MRYILSVAFLYCSCLVFAQPKKVVADKIIAIVGDKPILKSEIANVIADEQRRDPGAPIPENAGCMIVEQLLATRALVLQAERDSLPLSDEELTAQMEARVRYFVGEYGSTQAVEQVAGKSIYQLKEDMKQSFRENQLAGMMRGKIVDGVKISPTEVKAYYDKIPKDSLRFYEMEVELGEIVVYPKASRDLEKHALEELNGYRQQVESGKRQFETLAGLYSDDKETERRGGQLFMNRTDKIWDPTFLSTAFRLKPGQISPVIKSKFGYHIIQLVERNGDEATVRHILKIPQITGAELEEATKKLDSVRSQLIAGTISFGEAVSKYTDDENARYTGGMKQQSRTGSSLLTIDQLDKDLVLMLKDLKVGEYAQPVVFTDERQKKGVRLVYLKSKSAPHRENLKDDYDRVKQRAMDEKQQEALEKWFATKIPTYYIMVDDDIKSCPQLDLWLKNANLAQH